MYSLDKWRLLTPTLTYNNVGGLHRVTGFSPVCSEAILACHIEDERPGDWDLKPIRIQAKFSRVGAIRTVGLGAAYDLRCGYDPDPVMSGFVHEALWTGQESMSMIELPGAKVLSRREQDLARGSTELPIEIENPFGGGYFRGQGGQALLCPYLLNHVKYAVIRITGESGSWAEFSTPTLVISRPGPLKVSTIHWSPTRDGGSVNVDDYMHLDGYPVEVLLDAIVRYRPGHVAVQARPEWRTSPGGCEVVSLLERLAPKYEYQFYPPR